MSFMWAMRGLSTRLGIEPALVGLPGCSRPICTNHMEDVASDALPISLRGLSAFSRALIEAFN